MRRLRAAPRRPPLNLSPPCRAAAVSKLIPSGIRPTLRVDVKDGSGKEIGCLEFDVTIGSRGASLSDHSKRRLEFERAVVEEPEWRPVYEAWRREAA